METYKEDSNFMLNFLLENEASGGLSKEVVDKIKILWKKHKLEFVTDKCAIITADLGNLGSIVTRYVESVENSEIKLKYKTGSYDFISIKSNKTKRILWTDYKNIEPYNRQGGLYCDGASFDFLGNPVKETKEYREFISVDTSPSNIGFGVTGFEYNEFYGSLKLGLSINKKSVSGFIYALRMILNKLND